jgi:UPF0176 protein
MDGSPTANPHMRYLTAAFYLFTDLHDCAQFKAPLQDLCDAQQVKGLILLAPEGINSTIAGPADGVHTVLAWLRAQAPFAALQHKESWSDKAPFRRMRVRIKKEIVTMGVPGLRPASQAGQYVKPQDWNALIADPEVLLVDTRNDYEVKLGSFEGAINPGIQSFAQLPAWLAAQGLMDPARPRKVAMFCTGGIRCEKSTALLRAQGLQEVYHLEGGILKYLETVAPEMSRWQGECFVFDERVSVAHGVQTGSHQLCRCCRQPLPPGALQSEHYEPGVSCPRCFSMTSETQKKSARERQRQWERAKAKAALRDSLGIEGSEGGPSAIAPAAQDSITGYG